MRTPILTVVAVIVFAVGGSAVASPAVDGVPSSAPRGDVLVLVRSLEGCPDLPADQTPIDACPMDTVRVDENDDYVRCNYFTGDDSEPCPHSTDEYAIVRCDSDGAFAHVERVTLVESAEAICAGSYVVVDAA